MKYNNCDMHQGSENNDKEEDLNKIIFPHSVLVSAEPLTPKKEYKSILGKSLYLMYMDIYAEELDNLYTINFNMLDLTGKNADVQKLLNFKKLDKNFMIWMKSFLLVFKPFKRNILNFEKDKPITLREYLAYIKTWMPDSSENMTGFVDFGK